MSKECDHVFAIGVDNPDKHTMRPVKYHVSFLDTLRANLESSRQAELVDERHDGRARELREMSEDQYMLRTLIKLDCCCECGRENTVFPLPPNLENVMLEGKKVVQSGEKTDVNGVYVTYPEGVLMSIAEQINKRVGDDIPVLGQFGAGREGEAADTVHMEQVSHLVKNARVVGGGLLVDVKVLKTERGMDLYKLEQNNQADFQLRAMVDMAPGDGSGVRQVRSAKIVSIDVVAKL